MACVFIERRAADDDLAIGEAQRPALGEHERRAFRPDFASVGFVNEQDSRGMTPKVPRCLRRHHFERPAFAHAVNNRVATGVGSARLAENAAQTWTRLKDRFHIARHVIAAIRFGRKHTKHRRGVIGAMVRDKAGEQRGEARPRALDQGHALDGRVGKRVGDALLCRP